MPWVLVGIVLLLGFFASYLTALSWADVTFVLPATSFAYVVVALLSRFWLHEQITPARWLGIFCIVAGVGFVTRGPAYTGASCQTTPDPADSTRAVPITDRASMERSNDRQRHRSRARRHAGRECRYRHRGRHPHRFRIPADRRF